MRVSRSGWTTWRWWTGAGPRGEAEELGGDGDARAAAIYAAAYGQDQEFYAFHRSLQAYRESFSSKEDVLVLDPKSDFFRYLQSNK